MSLKQAWYSFFGCLVFAGVFLVSVWLYRHWDDQDLQTVVIHAAVDCIPFLAAIVFALWPQEISSMHVGWRVAVLIGGLVWTGLLVKKDRLDLLSSKHDLQSAVTNAVEQANKHTDSQIGGVRKDLDNTNRNLSGQIADMGKNANSSASNLANLFKSTASDIEKNIEGFKPSMPDPAKFVFTFYRPDQGFPVLAEVVNQDRDGSFKNRIYIEKCF